MLHKRSAAVAAAFVAAVTSPVLTAVSASARDIPWTEQTVFAIGPTDNYVAEWMGLSQGWTIIGGPEGFASVNDIAVGSGAVYRINPATASGVTVVDEWTGGTTWTPILTVGSNQYPGSLIAGYDGVYLDDVTSTSDAYLEYSGTPNDWSQISEIDYYGDGLYPMVESTTSLYGATLDNLDGDDASTDVEIYSGSGSSWTVIGGPADSNLAAGG